MLPNLHSLPVHSDRSHPPQSLPLLRLPLPYLPPRNHCAAATMGFSSPHSPILASDCPGQVDSMSQLTSGAGRFSHINVVLLGEDSASESDDLVFPSPEISSHTLISSPDQHWDVHPAITAVGVVDATSEAIFRTVISLDPSRAEWDFCLSQDTVFEHMDGHTDIIHKKLRGDWFPCFQGNKTERSTFTSILEKGR